MDAPRYSPDEIDALAGWLREGATASEITGLFGQQFRIVSRSAIMGIVHRNKMLKAIGFARNLGGARFKGAVPQQCERKPARQQRQNLHPANIRGKLEGRRLDPGLPEPKPRSVDDGVSPYVYDGSSRAILLIELGARDCRFPVNRAEPGEAHLFCGRPAAAGRPYCGHHCRRAGAGYRAEAA
jgi:GcrA cell cycle regulator